MAYISRRHLITTGMSVLFVPRKGKAGPLPQAPKTPRQYNISPGRAQFVPLGSSAWTNGGDLPAANGLTAAAGNPIEEQIAFVAPANADITMLQVGMPGWQVSAFNEQFNTQTIVWKASIETPTGTTVVDVKWSGQRTLTAVPAKTTYWSDNVRVFIGRGTIYGVRLFGILQGCCVPAFGITVSGGSITAIGGLPISSMTWSNGVVYATTTQAHLYCPGITVPMTIAGVTPSGYNGVVTATITGSSTFSFPLATNPGSVTVQGTYSSNGQGLQSAPTLSLTPLGSGTGASITPTYNYSVSPIVTFTNNGTTQYTGVPTVTSSGGNGTTQPTWRAVMSNGWIVDLVQVTPGSNDFTSAPTLSFSGGGGSGAAATCQLQNGQLNGTPSFVAGSGYTNGTYTSQQCMTAGGISFAGGSGTANENQLYREFFYASSTAVDVTDNVFAISGGTYSSYDLNPVLRGVLSSNLAAPVILGTSIEAGYQTASDFNKRYGWISRSISGEGLNGGVGGLTSGLPYLDLAKSSSAAQGLIGSGSAQIQLAIDCGCTHAIIGHPGNDIANGLTAAQVETIMNQLWDMLLAAGMKVIQLTVLPRSTSTDYWLTTTNQTAWSKDSVRLSVNTYIRDLNVSNLSVCDIAAWAEYGGASSPSGLWTPTGYTGQGVAIYATMSGGSITALQYATRTGLTPVPANYLSGGSGSANIQFWGGGGGTGAAGTVTITSGTPSTGTPTLVSEGSGYLWTPLAALQGSPTADGTHLSEYGAMLATVANLITPNSFPL